jgi:preprotein translocase SecE subunit
MASATDVKRGGNGGRSTPPPAAAGAGSTTPPSNGKLKNYFNELSFEWKKISFPSRKELQQSTVVVFVFTLLVMSVISVFDLAVSWFFTNFILPASGVGP